jgi:hypothetical protein
MTTNNALKEFCHLMVKTFGAQYLHQNPTAEEKKRILEINERRGFRGGFSSWDCKHYVWESCPVQLAGQHKGHAQGRKNTLIMEGMADADLYIWSTFFGEAGSLNDINVLDKSTLVIAILSGAFGIKTEKYAQSALMRLALLFC